MVTSHLHNTSRRETRKNDTFCVSYDRDEPILRAYLSALEREDWNAAAIELGNALTIEPFLIAHPDVMYVLQWLYDEPNNSQPHSVELMSYLIGKFGTGLLRGVKITIDHEPKHVRGPRYFLFPHLKEHQGWSRTVAARNERYEASLLVKCVEELGHRVKKSQGWRATWREYHKCPRTRDTTVMEVAQSTMEIFELFKKGCHVTGKALGLTDYLPILRQGLQNRSCQQITYSLIATLSFPCFRNAGNKLTWKLIKNTVDQLDDDFFT